MAERANYPYAEFSQLAGPLQAPPADGRVGFRRVARGWARFRAWLLVVGAFTFEVVFLIWLLQPAHYPEFLGDWRSVLSRVLLVSVGVIGALQIVNVTTLAIATLHARDPIPVTPLDDRRVAFLTTIVPGKEPLEMVRRTLEAARRMRYHGRLDLWLLDEGDDPAVRAMCAELGVHHFSRKGVPGWNRESGPHKARTKHGNYNAWLDAHGDGYDFWVSVDTDHAPLPNMVERLVGYFRDPDVAFVVGPQVYGNYDGAVTRGAESQQYMFHSVLQRAGNRLAAPMFVGTNNAVRISALRAIGGLQDSITEDAATSVVWHASRNPQTGARWKSVYTPDVLAVGEGPATWRDFFTQQHRWACGADLTILRQFRRSFWRLSLAGKAHYVMLLAYYPSAAISWVLGALNLVAFLLFGVGALDVPAELWLMLYVNSAVLHIGVYFWNRKHNVSPHEQEGSSGLAGMAMSAMSAPIYVQALSQALRRREPTFVVTRKGAVAGDHLRVFRRHLCWALLLVGGLVASFPLGHVHVAIHAWAVASAVMCLLPVALWLGSAARRRRAAARRYRFTSNSVREHAPAVPAVVTSPAALGAPDAREPRMIRRRPPLLRRLRNAALVLVASAAVVAANGPVVVDAVDYARYEYQRHQADYKEQYGYWETVELPEQFRLSAIHAALLHTGKVLLIAGSGSNAERFEAGTFRSILWDPATGNSKEIPTPEDFFCAGHAYLPNGDLLIAGGTRAYEQLEDQVDRAAGVLSLTNDHDEALVLPEGTEFVSRGLNYRSTEVVTLPAAHEMPDGTEMAGVADVWVEAEGRGDEYVVQQDRLFGVRDLTGAHRGQVRGRSNSVTKEKQNFQGLDASYEFDVATESYRRAGRLDEPRWYPTLINLEDGRILAVSGLDEYGRVLPGDNEIYDPATRTWTDQPQLFRYFPTYPALFRLADGKRIFYSGSNTGYGPHDQGRQPGIWNLADNTWADVPGLEDPEYNETSASFFLAPVQEQRVGIVGGGLVGDSDESTARFNVVDLSSAEPRYAPAPDHPSPARYVNAVTLPDDTTLLTGGSVGYRGNGESDLHLTTRYDPHSGTLHEAAPNQVGRNYHATALLLPDGRVMTMGSDPLFADADRTKSGTFETRIEIYSPPYLFAGNRAELTSAPTEITRGEAFAVSTDTTIAQARLLRPSAVTHQTDTEQRSIALDVAASTDDTYALSVPPEEGLTPSGWYMLVVLDDRGVPSPARWVRVR